MTTFIFFVKLQCTPDLKAYFLAMVGVIDALCDFWFYKLVFEMAKSGFDILIKGTALPQIFIWAVDAP